jgi:IS30 family transposase
VPGHWEGDLIFGANNSQIATLVERKTRYVMLAKVNNKDSETVINALVKHAHRLPKELYADAEAICEAVGRPNMRFVPNRRA